MNLYTQLGEVEVIFQGGLHHSHWNFGGLMGISWGSEDDDVGEYPGFNGIKGYLAKFLGIYHPPN